MPKHTRKQCNQQHVLATNHHWEERSNLFGSWYKMRFLLTEMDAIKEQLVDELVLKIHIYKNAYSHLLYQTAWNSSRPRVTLTKYFDMTCGSFSYDSNIDTLVLFLTLAMQVVQVSLDSGDIDAIQPKSLITVLFQIMKYKCKITQRWNN